MRTRSEVEARLNEMVEEVLVDAEQDLRLADLAVSSGVLVGFLGAVVEAEIYSPEIRTQFERALTLLFDARSRPSARMKEYAERMGRPSSLLIEAIFLAPSKEAFLAYTLQQFDKSFKYEVAHV